jgi:hypothetical protein
VVAVAEHEATLVLGKLKEGSFLFCSQFLNDQSNSRNLLGDGVGGEFEFYPMFLTSP